MKLAYHKTFQKHYLKLREKEQRRVGEAIILFQKNAFAQKLENHALKGDMHGKRAVSPGGDLRIIFREKDKYTEVLFLDVDSHNQVY